jgi:hypothetical protein
LKRNRTISVILFVLGLGLVVLGVGLSDFSQTNLFLQGRYTTYPYMGLGEAVIIIGLVALSVAYVMIIRGEKSSERS